MATLALLAPTRIWLLLDYLLYVVQDICLRADAIINSHMSISQGQYRLRFQMTALALLGPSFAAIAYRLSSVIAVYFT
jgi:hypothetical protein